MNNALLQRYPAITVSEESMKRFFVALVALLALCVFIQSFSASTASDQKTEPTLAKAELIP